MIHNKCFLNTFTIAVGIRVFTSVFCVFDICRHNVYTISKEIKSQLVKHAKVEKSENSFVRVG